MRAVKLTAAALALAWTCERAHADASAAARAFSEGQAAQLAGDYDRAAQSYELAFSIQPSKEALRSAVRARQLGNQLQRAATLSELLLAMYSDDEVSKTLAGEVIAAAKPQFARIAIKCTAPCTIAVGGRAASLLPGAAHAIYLTPGAQAIQVSFERDLAVNRDVNVKAGEDSTLEITKPDAKEPPPKIEPPVTPPPEEEPRGGLSPIVPIVGAGVTVVLAGITTWSGVDTLKAHDKYVEDPTDAAYDAGRGKQLRTNIMLGVTGVAALTTAAIAIFWTNWHGTQPTVNATSESATVGIVGRF